jgi:hypothetical protein
MSSAIENLEWDGGIHDCGAFDLAVWAKLAALMELSFFTNFSEAVELKH